MTKNLDRIKIKAFLQTLKEQYPEQFAPAVEEFMNEEPVSSEVIKVATDEEVDYFIRKNFDQYADVYKALA